MVTWMEQFKPQGGMWMCTLGNRKRKVQFITNVNPQTLVCQLYIHVNRPLLHIYIRYIISGLLTFTHVGRAEGYCWDFNRATNRLQSYKDHQN